MMKQSGFFDEPQVDFVDLERRLASFDAAERSVAAREVAETPGPEAERLLIHAIAD